MGQRKHQRRNYTFEMNENEVYQNLLNEARAVLEGNLQWQMPILKKEDLKSIT